jgi:hypothetical protein
MLLMTHGTWTFDVLCYLHNEFVDKIAHEQEVRREQYGNTVLNIQLGLNRLDLAIFAIFDHVACALCDGVAIFLLIKYG